MSEASNSVASLSLAVTIVWTSASTRSRSCTKARPSDPRREKYERTRARRFDAFPT